MDLDELLAALRRGEPGAREQFGLAVREELYRFFSNCFGPTDADELTHEAFVVMWEKLDRFESRGHGYFVRWLNVIAANKACARRQAPVREAARQDKLREHQAMAEPMISPGSCVFEREQHEILERCKDELPDDERKVIEHTLAGGDDRALAEEDGIKTGSIRTRRHRAKVHVQQLIEANRKTPDSERSPPPS
jgi:RNA polymerase sigma factor (sigma-70 family)